MRRLAITSTVMLAASVALTGSMAAYAAPPPLVITTQITFHPDHNPASATFTASGLPGCPSGTSTDSVVSFNPQGTRLVLDEHDTCLNGSTFTARVALHVAEVAPDGTQASDGTWRIIASDSGLAGSGDLIGVNTGCAPVGTIFAACTAGSALVVGQAK
jgi:hypothetical protein